MNSLLNKSYEDSLKVYCVLEKSLNLRLEAEVYREAGFVGLVEGVPISSFGGCDGGEWGPGMFRVIFF